MRERTKSEVHPVVLSRFSSLTSTEGYLSSRNSLLTSNLPSHYFKRKLDKSLKRIDADGLEKVNESKTLPQRLFWAILFTVATIISLFEVYKAISDFYNSPIVTSYRIVTKDEMELPQIYLCPSMKVRKSYLQSNREEVDAALKLGDILFMENLHNLFNNFSENSLDVVQNQTLRYKGLIDAQASAITEHPQDDAQFLKQTFMAMGAEQYNIFIYCMFRSFFLAGVPCANISRPVLDPVYGKCFLIDVRLSGADRKQEVPAQGLTIILNLQTQQFPEDNDLAPKYDGYTIRLARKLDPTVHASYVVPTETYTKVDIAATHLQFLNIDSGPRLQLCNTIEDFQYKILNADYSPSSCRMECYFRTMDKHCSCIAIVDTVFLKPGITNEYSFCTVDQMEKCLLTMANSSEIQHEIETCTGGCNIPCDSWAFDARISSMPLNEYFVEPLPNSTLRDYAFVQFSFPFMEYEEFSQEWSMSVSDLISTIGSQFGLWIGISIIGIIQIPVTIVSRIGFRIYTKFHK